MPRFILMFISLLLTGAHSALGIAPPFMDDAELAQSPIIVVAQWEQVPFTPHLKYRDDDELGQVVVAFEAYTKLRILRVIKGKGVKPGEHHLMTGMGISWSEDGEWVSSGTSTELIGDTKDITKPRLWFLKKARSWDETRPDEYLSISNYRSIQPTELENYFLAMGSDRPRTEVPRLLSAERPLEAIRVLRYLSGGIWPWPYDPSSFEARYANPKSRGTLLKDRSGEVWDLVGSAEGGLRPRALSVFAELAGQDGIKRVRTMLNDGDPEVRGAAIGILARHRDRASVEQFGEAARSVNNGTLSCKVITELLAWGDENVVPALITFLQNSDFAYQYGDDLGIPALKTRQALKDITGHWFPFDVERSAQAWAQASRVQDPAERLAMLEKLIPGIETPLMAELVGKPVYRKPKDPPSSRDVTATIRLHNISPQQVTVSRRPYDVSMSWPAGSSSRSSSSPEKLDSGHFVTLDPGTHREFQVELHESFLLAEPKRRSLRLSYQDNGNTVGVNAWIGALEVGRSSDWKEERVVKLVEETWPNGNLKSVGKTINGHETGEWNYFNEQGDRIKTVYYGEARGTATCNPEHPDNKGAGIRARKQQDPTP
jgi:hypothetical protein